MTGKVTRRIVSSQATKQPLSTTSTKRFRNSELNDFLRACSKLSDGNRGANSVCQYLYDGWYELDMNVKGGSSWAYHALNDAGIYGERIWKLFKDVSKGKLMHTLIVLRGFQEGIISRDVLNNAIDSGQEINISEVASALQTKTQLKIDLDKKLVLRSL